MYSDCVRKHFNTKHSQVANGYSLPQSDGSVDRVACAVGHCEQKLSVSSDVQSRLVDFVRKGKPDVMVELRYKCDNCTKLTANDDLKLNELSLPECAVCANRHDLKAHHVVHPFVGLEFPELPKVSSFFHFILVVICKMSNIDEK